VLIKLPKSQHAKAKRALQEIWMAETKKEALVAFDVFVETWGVKYDKAVECLNKDREALLAFYDFPVLHLDRKLERMLTMLIRLQERRLRIQSTRPANRS
jgi:transposase-like protein